MNRSIIISCIIISLASATALAGTKIDPYIDSVTGLKAFSLTKSHTSKNNIAKRIAVFIKTRDVKKTRRVVESTGGVVHATVGDILTAVVDSEALKGIARGSEVIFIEVAKPVHLKNDVAAGEVNSLEVHEGVNLPKAYTGKGVIVGLIDTGLDYRHPDFLDADGKSRILAIWDQTRSGGPVPAEIENGFGTECQSRSIEDGSCPMRDLDGHGTHVAATMAGRDPKFSGVAPDANIIAVSYDSSIGLGSGYAETIFSTKICLAAYYIFAKAAKLKMPAVVNLSLGTHIGAHDGSSLFEECLSSLLKDSAGRAIVAAAGNEYSSDATYTGIHAGVSGDGMTAANFVIRQATADPVYYIDLWGTEGGNLSVGLAIHDGTPEAGPKEFSGLVDAGDRREGSFLGGGISYLINATETSSALNGKQHVGIRIALDKAIGTPSRYSFDLVVKGKGSYDAWLFPDKPAKIIQFTSLSGSRGAEWAYIAGDRIKNVAVPATSGDVIAVAGYTTRNVWDGGGGCCKVALALGGLLDFSSSGPSAAPEVTGIKPDLAAPGGMIASALSSDARPERQLIMEDGMHFLEAGTSMSAPFVSGAIALMFSANPNFTHKDVKRYLTGSAYVDTDVGEVPNNRWGAGKLDVLAALEAAIKGGASGDFSSNGEVGASIIEEGPSGSGCTLIASQSADLSPMFFWCLMIGTCLTLLINPKSSKMSADTSLPGPCRIFGGSFFSHQDIDRIYGGPAR